MQEEAKKDCLAGVRLGKRVRAVVMNPAYCKCGRTSPELFLPPYLTLSPPYTALAAEQHFCKCCIQKEYFKTVAFEKFESLGRNDHPIQLPNAKQRAKRRQEDKEIGHGALAYNFYTNLLCSQT